MKEYDAQSVGKRKSSIARVYMSQGSGKIVVNNRDYKDYFQNGTSQYVVTQPLVLVKKLDQMDIKVNVCGGGLTGQAGAVRLAVARALEKIDPALRSDLKKAGFLTRDARVVERKKFGLRGARRSFQFSKR